MDDALRAVGRRLDAWTTGVRARRVVSPLTRDVLAARLAAYDFARPVPLAALTEDVADLLEHGTIHSTHPRYFGLFNPGVCAAGVAADALAAGYNPQLAAWWHAPAASELERHVLDFFRARIPWPASAVASFTTGGSEANLTGVLAALAAAVPGLAQDGLGGVRAALYASDQAHDSFVKIARMVGVGERAVRRVRSDPRQRLDVDALRDAIAADRRAGLTPFLVVATVGTTATGAVDPLHELADLCAEERLWLHADAAWGGMALLSDTLRTAVAGLERADSITWDAHKTLPVPMGAGMFFARHRAFADTLFGVRTAYVPAGAAGSPEPFQQTVQWSRRAIGLKVFMTAAEMGRAGLAAMVDHQAAMAGRLRDALQAAGWQIANDTPLPLVCVTRADLTDDAIAAVARAVVAEGQAWISDVRLPDGRRWLRACITHHDTQPEDVAALVEALHRAAGARSRASAG